MNKKNQLTALMGTLSLLLVVVVISCTRNLSVPITAIVVTSTPSFTATNTQPLITNTATNTATNTPTATNTQPVITYTFTNTFTVTDTPTITNTFTITPTFTITLTATNTLPPNTATITNTPSATGTPTNTPTVTNTAPAVATPTPSSPTSSMFDDFSEAPWMSPNWTNTGGAGYLVNVYVDATTTYNSGSLNTTNTQAGVAGALDLNVTFTANTGNLLEATILNGASYGNNVNEQANFGGVNPSAVAFWVNPGVATMATAKVWIDQGGTNYSIVNVVPCPMNTWTYVYTVIPGTVPAMTAVKAVIVDMTSSTITTTDVLYDNIYFFQ